MHFNFTPLKLLLLLLAVSALCNAKAQDIDRKRVDIDYIRIPLIALPSDIETYFVNVKPGNTSWGNSLGNVYDAEKIRLNGYYLLPDASDADLLIETELVNDLVFDRADERKADLTYKKDKNSPEIKYTAYYYYLTYYTPKIRYRFHTKSGKAVAEGDIGGVKTGVEYGSTSYSNYFSNAYSLANAFRNDKHGMMASYEKDAYQAALNTTRNICLNYCMYPVRVDFSVRYVDEKRGKTVYADLMEARDFYLEAVATLKNDKIDMINKLIQPDYETRKATMNKAIALWEKALSEADYDNKKARIDAKIARHLYYNLALGYLWIDDFVKAKEYAQGRKKDLGSWDKNFLSGIQALSSIIDDRAARQQANKWRTVLLSDENVYVYKDPATRKKELEETARAETARLAMVKTARADSLSKVNKLKKSPAAKSTVKKTPATAPAQPALKKSAASGATVRK